MNELELWAARWGIPREAIAELIGAIPDNPKAPGGTEARVQADLRLMAPAIGVLLWRNNRGSAVGPNGQMVRFGLANDSPQVNRRVKSSDLIGIGADGRFVSVEVKKPGWTYRGTPEEEAQLAWIRLVQAHGGRAGFANCVTQLPEILGYV